MFNNKREIFSFRKYKAYGLASAVIAAFFLAGGVASADEVTAPTTTPAVAQTAPSEASTTTQEASTATNPTVSAGEALPTVTSAAPTGTAVASTETAVDGATYASDTAKQAVQAHLAPLAQSTTPAPTAAQIYKENPAIASKLTSDDKAVEAENKEAFDKLPDAVRRRVKSVTIDKKEDGNLGHTASISGNVTLNAQYFHNDGKDGETEVLYHEIGHAIDGATYKRNADGSDYSLSRDAAVQPLIHKVYPGQVNYEGWASMFGTYMLQKTGQREIKTDLDREINQYFSALMVGFTESETKLHGDFVVTGTNKSEKHLVKADQKQGAYLLQGTYTFSASGTETITGAKLVYESSKQFLVYTTDTDVKNGTYGEAPSDLSAVTAVRYKFNSPLTLKTGDAFITNMKVRVPENAPTATPATSQLFTSANGTSFLDGNTVSITTTRNTGNVVAYYVDTQGHTLKNPVTQIGLNKMTYRTSKPEVITDDGFNYMFKEIKNTNDSGDVQTHIYKLIETEVPNDVPQVDVPALNVTRYVNEEGTEIKDAETGHVPAPSMIGDNYQFTGRTDSTEDGTVQTHVYKAVEHEVPNDAPKRLPEELQITRFVTEDGKDIAPIESGIVGERPVIGEYQYTGRSTHEEGIHTHYYKLIEHDVPNDAPQVDVPALNVTRYVNEEGSEIKDAEKGLVPAPSMIGDTYEFTGRTETTEDGTVQTHVYKVVEHQVPGDAPQVDVPKLLVTRFVNETGDEIKSATDSFVDALPQIDNYEFTGVTKLNDGKDVQTHVYRLSVHEVPNDAPQVDVPELQITRHVDGDGNDLTEVEKGRQAPKPTIREYQYTDRTTEEHGITTHFYAPIKHEVPNEAPIVDVPELLITRHVNEKGDELLPIEEGSNGPRKTIGNYEYTGRTDVEGGITTHVYAPIKYEVPNDAPIVDVPELQITRHIDEFGNDLVKVEKGRQAPKPTIREYQYTDRTTEEHGITTHFYAPIKHEVPNDAPIVEIPELQITRYVDGDGHDLQTLNVVIMSQNQSWVTMNSQVAPLRRMVLPRTTTNAFLTLMNQNVKCLQWKHLRMNQNVKFLQWKHLRMNQNVKFLQLKHQNKKFL